jgi:hypothetical protein
MYAGSAFRNETHTLVMTHPFKSALLSIPHLFLFRYRSDHRSEHSPTWMLEIYIVLPHGKKIRMTEAVCFRTLMSRNWNMGHILHQGETNELWQEKVLYPKLRAALIAGK